MAAQGVRGSLLRHAALRLVGEDRLEAAAHVARDGDGLLVELDKRCRFLASLLVTLLNIVDGHGLLAALHLVC